MIFNLRNKGLGRFIFLKTIVLLFIFIFYFNAKDNSTKQLISSNSSIADSHMDDSNLKAKRFYIFEELGISVAPISFGASCEVSPKYFILDEIEKARNSELRSFKLIHVLADSLSRDKIKNWRRYSYRSKIVAKQGDPQFLTTLTTQENKLYIKAAPYWEKAKEISKITGLDEKIFLSLFYAESNLTHFACSNFDKETWGLIISPRNAMGLAQITENGLDLLDNEYHIRKSVINKRKKIIEKINQKKSIEDITADVRTGRNYILYLMQQQGVDISSYDISDEETDYLRLSFATLEEAGNYDNMVDISFAVLNQLLGGTYVDKEKYKQEPLYAFTVGSAYFYLDYIYFLNHPTLEIEREQLLEVCVSAYNRGRYGTQRSILRRGENWHSLKYRETRGHWRSFQNSFAIFSEIHAKFKKANESMMVQDDIS